MVRRMMHEPSFSSVMSQVPTDLLVAHAEKRVLEGALDEAARKAADAEVGIDFVSYEEALFRNLFDAQPSFF